jgi:hypothetical protein
LRSQQRRADTPGDERAKNLASGPHGAGAYHPRPEVKDSALAKKIVKNERGRVVR